MGRTVWAWVRMLGGLAILGVLGWRLGASAFVSGLHVIDGGTLLAACGIGLLTTVFSAWRWRLVARGLGIDLPLRTAVADYYRALFLNAALPGGVLGDVHRAVRHGQEAGDVGRGVRAVVLERTAGMVVFVAAGLGLLLALPTPLPSLTRLLPAAAHTGGIALLAVLAVAGLLAWFRPWRGASRWARGLRTSLVDVRRGLFSATTGPGIVLASTVVLGGHLATFLVAARAAGSTAPLATLAPLMVLALLAMVLPLSVGGWGPREGVTAWAFGAAGLSPSLGLTIAVVYGVLAFAASLPGAAILLYRWLAAVRTPAVHAPAAPAAAGATPAAADPAASTPPPPADPAASTPPPPADPAASTPLPPADPAAPTPPPPADQGQTHVVRSPIHLLSTLIDGNALDRRWLGARGGARRELAHASKRADIA